MIGKSLPSWLIQSKSVLLRKFVRNKSDPLVDEVELLEANPNFAKVRFLNGRESTVSINDLAPCPPEEGNKQPISPINRIPLDENQPLDLHTGSCTENVVKDGTSFSSDNISYSEQPTISYSQPSSDSSSHALRHSERQRCPPQRYGQNIYDK